MITSSTNLTSTTRGKTSWRVFLRQVLTLPLEVVFSRTLACRTCRQVWPRIPLWRLKMCLTFLTRTRCHFARTPWTSAKSPTLSSRRWAPSCSKKRTLRWKKWSQPPSEALACLKPNRALTHWSRTWESLVPPRSLNPSMNLQSDAWRCGPSGD